MWIGKAPATCGLCGQKIVNTFIDGATTQGPWANMCPRCHSVYGRGLGTGRGQKYIKNSDGVFEEIRK